MSTAASIRRVAKELKDLANKPIREFTLVPLESNMLEVHFTLVGPDDSPYAGGLYHGRVIIPAEYPFAPPDVVLLTPNGRFEVGKKVCLSVSSYHPEHWKATWGMGTILHSLRSFMLTAGTSGIGSINYPAEKRRELAKESHSFVCKECGSSVAEQWEEILKNALPATDTDKGELLPPPQTPPPTPTAAPATPSAQPSLDGALAIDPNTSSSVAPKQEGDALQPPNVDSLFDASVATSKEENKSHMGTEEGSGCKGGSNSTQANHLPPENNNNGISISSSKANDESLSDRQPHQSHVNPSPAQYASTASAPTLLGDREAIVVDLGTADMQDTQAKGGLQISVQNEAKKTSSAEEERTTKQGEGDKQQVSPAATRETVVGINGGISLSQPAPTDDVNDATHQPNIAVSENEKKVETQLEPHPLDDEEVKAPPRVAGDVVAEVAAAAAAAAPAADNLPPPQAAQPEIQLPAQRRRNGIWHEGGINYEINIKDIDRALFISVTVFIAMLIKKAIFDWPCADQLHYFASSLWEFTLRFVRALIGDADGGDGTWFLIG